MKYETNNKGTVSIVAKTGGLKFAELGEQWYNRTEKCLGFTKNIKVGDTANFNVSKEDPTLITYMEITAGTTKPTITAPAPTNETQSNKVPDSVWDAKDRRIVRQNSLSQANEMIKTLAALQALEGYSEADVNRLILKNAALFEAWVYRTETQPVVHPEEHVEG